jgi:ubiquinone/menaquinone biosynthesis C-methylase UbiE
MIKTQEAYNEWSKTYDNVVNPTRDLEAKAIRTILHNITVDSILEIGCGTGKNTEWLSGKCERLTAVDFSMEMLQIAREKIKSEKIIFRQADITLPWDFNKADLITCSLVLEHIENISYIFEQASQCLQPGGLFYICELHPYKQLAGSRAKFEKDGTLIQLEYFIHHISEFFSSALQNGFICEQLQEWFDDEESKQLPRLVSFLFKKK